MSEKHTFTLPAFPAITTSRQITIATLADNSAGNSTEHPGVLSLSVYSEPRLSRHQLFPSIRILPIQELTQQHLETQSESYEL